MAAVYSTLMVLTLLALSGVLTLFVMGYVRPEFVYRIAWPCLRRFRAGIARHSFRLFRFECQAQVPRMRRATAGIDAASRRSAIAAFVSKASVR